MSHPRKAFTKTEIYRPQHPALQWIEKRLPIGRLFYSEFVAYPTPRNLNYWWTFGAILTFLLGSQIATGIILAMHYTPHVDLAFKSVEGIMRDVNYGWLVRYLHSTGASMFFSLSTSTRFAASITVRTRRLVSWCGFWASSSTC